MDSTIMDLIDICLLSCYRACYGSRAPAIYNALPPMPDRIPRPNTHVLGKMKEDKIRLFARPGDLFVKYELPKGWELVQLSASELVPVWIIIDETSHARYQISGKWNSYDNNKLKTLWLKNPFPFMKKKEEKKHEKEEEGEEMHDIMVMKEHDWEPDPD